MVGIVRTDGCEKKKERRNVSVTATADAALRLLPSAFIGREGGVRFEKTLTSERRKAKSRESGFRSLSGPRRAKGYLEFI